MSEQQPAPKRRFLESDERRHALATTIVVTLGIVAVLGLILGVAWSINHHNAAKTERQSIACIQQGGVWIESYSNCVYSQRVQP